MGIIGIHQELFIMPLTPIKTPSTCTTTTSSTTRKRKEEEEEDNEAASSSSSSSCDTPKSESSPPPPRCPPPPIKPRPVRRKFPSDEAPKLGFFQVPEDLASVFRLITPPNKKIRTS